jgi:hypothetical protein
MSYDDLSEAIIENNREIKIDTIKLGNNKEKKKKKHMSLFVKDQDYLEDTDRNKVVCVRCTKSFFDIFFNGQYDENDPAMVEIFKSKVYMSWIPDEQIYRCAQCGHVELIRDPQYSKEKDKKILGAGIENFPEYVSYMNPNSVKADYIGTANTGKKKKTFRAVFEEETEEEKFMRYLGRNRS